MRCALLANYNIFYVSFQLCHEISRRKYPSSPPGDTRQRDQWSWMFHIHYSYRRCPFVFSCSSYEETRSLCFGERYYHLERLNAEKSSGRITSWSKYRPYFYPVTDYGKKTPSTILSLTKRTVMPGRMKMKKRKNKGGQVENKKSTEEEKRETVKHKGNWTRKEKWADKKTNKEIDISCQINICIVQNATVSFRRLEDGTKGFSCGPPPPPITLKNHGFLT